MGKADLSQLLDGGLPAALLPAQAPDQLLSSGKLDCAVSHLLRQGLLLGRGFAELAFQATDVGFYGLYST